MLLLMVLAPSLVSPTVDLGVSEIYLSTVRQRNAAFARVTDKGLVLITLLSGAGERHSFVWKQGALVELKGFVGRDLNAPGVVVGNTEARGIEHPAIWKAGQITRFTPDRQGEAVAINEKGDVAGYWYDGRKHVAWVRRGTKLSPIGPSSYDIEPFDIDEKGTVLGTWMETKNSDVQQWGFIRGRHVQPFYTRKAYWGQPEQMNVEGDVIGSVSGPEAVYGFIRQQGKNSVLSFYTLTNGLNDHGVVVGTQSRYPEDPEMQEKALIWREGKMAELQDAYPPDPGWAWRGALAINNRDEVVGYGLHDGHWAVFFLHK